MMAIDTWVHIFIADVVFGLFSRAQRYTDQLDNDLGFKLEVLATSLYEGRQVLMNSKLVKVGKNTTIHPGALGAVLDLLRHASRNMQVVITTHSPELLDAKWIGERHLRVVVWRDGASRALRPSEASRQALREHLMGAGELLRANALEPEELFDPDMEQGRLFAEMR